MDKQNIDIAEIYKKHYETWEKHSICLNMKKYESKGCFHFLLKGCGYVLDESVYVVFFRCIPFIGKTKDCKIIIDFRYKYCYFNRVVKALEKGIDKWEKQYYETIIENLSMKYGIEEKAIVDVLKKEISFMKNRLIFRKWWFLK